MEVFGIGERLTPHSVIIGSALSGASFFVLL